MLESLISILVFLVILSILVLIHEAGHYLVAKKLGIKVEEFGWGMPPRLWGKKIGETIYSINWLPIGGFVKLYGEDDAGGGKVDVSDPRDKVKKSELKRAFFARPAWQRAAVVVAGVVMNLVLAALIYYVYLGISGFRTEIPLIGDHKFFGANQTNVIKSLMVYEVAPDSPAANAGLKNCTEDFCAQVTKINGKQITESENFVNTVKENAGKQVEFTIVNLANGETVEKTMIPRENPPEGEGALGIVFDTNRVAVLSYDTPLQRLFSGFTHPINLMAYQLNILSKLINTSFVNRDIQPVSTAVSGPVGIFVVTGEVLKTPDLQERLMSLLNLAGLLSISLAFFNILPIPALDGGRLFFILVEWISGKKVNPKTETLIHTAGMAVLLGLIVLITYKDIMQFFF